MSQVLLSWTLLTEFVNFWYISKVSDIYTIVHIYDKIHSKFEQGSLQNKSEIYCRLFCSNLPCIRPKVLQNRQYFP